MAAPLFGDTTATQALIFSSPFLDAPREEVTYPNYVLPPANSSIPDSVPTPPTQNLLVYKTANISSLVGLLNASFCAMAELPGNQIAPSRPLTSSTVLRDSTGWRTQWLLEGLAPSTNYTIFIVQDQALVSPPLYLSTKSGKHFFMVNQLSR